MKDRYLFKAKLVDNGEWVEGDLFSDGMINSKRMFVGNLVITDYKGTSCDRWNVGTDFYEVIPETICQCTGLKDTNGNLIYENDILKCCRLDKYDDQERFREHIESVDWEDYGFYVKDGDTGSDSLCLYDNSIDYINTIATAEVIGNKFDNPELLEVENEIN